MSIIQEIYLKFSLALNAYNRQEALNIAMRALQSTDVDVPTLYETILAPSLNQIASNSSDQDIYIWEEHIKSSIVRTVIENVYPFVLQSKMNINKKAMVLCLEEEYHELGARMSADYLTLLGFETFFIGANTPKKEVVHALKVLQPDLVSISITNYYHLTRIHTFIDMLKSELIPHPYKLMIGGYAVHSSSNVHQQVVADYYVQTFEDLKRVQEDFL